MLMVLNLYWYSLTIKLSLAILALVAAFNLEIGITGAILTKLDGDSRGGAALSVRECTLDVIRCHFIGATRAFDIAGWMTNYMLALHHEWRCTLDVIRFHIVGATRAFDIAGWMTDDMLALRY
ncbi:hypothetical protein KI387_023904, partial [Taxus chinensis]